MKNVFVLFLIGLMVISCGTTKEMEEVVEEPTIQTERPAPQTMNKEKRKGSMDADQLAAQLGLAEDQEDAFIDMWNKTSEAMQQIRIENRGDRDAMLLGMKTVKAERVEGLERILTDDQMILYYEIMQRNKGKVNGKLYFLRYNLMF